MTMSPHRFSFTRFKQAASAFRFDDNGNFALMTGLMLVPLLGFSGLAIDHWKVSTSKSDIENAADAAALGAINRAAAVLRATGDRNKAVTEGQAAGYDQFLGNVGKIPGTTTGAPVIKVAVKGLEVTSSVGWNANVKTTFGSFFNWNNQNLAGVSASSLTMPAYVQIHVVVDNSGSMGIGATEAAQDQLFAKTGCAIACHVDGKGSYDIARANKIQTRIDVVRDVLIDVARSVAEKTTIKNQIKISVSTFSNDFAQFVRISDPEAANMASFEKKMSILGLASTGGGTDFHGTFKKIPSVLPAGGDGTTESQPILYVFFITDGVEHTVQRTTQPSWVVDPDTLLNNSPVFVSPHPAVNNEFMSTYSYDGVKRTADTGWVQPLDPNICSSVKQRARLLTLEIEYLVPDREYWDHKPFGDDIRFGWIKDNLLKKEGEYTLSHNRFRKCASTPEDASLARTDKEIQSTIQSMFEKVLPKPPRLLK